jgi:hypothetical protein
MYQILNHRIWKLMVKYVLSKNENANNEILLLTVIAKYNLKEPYYMEGSTPDQLALTCSRTLLH